MEILLPVNGRDEYVEKTTERKWFNVNPLDIDSSLFTQKREDEKQEATRILILEALGEVRRQPNRYAKPFKTMIPKKTWTTKNGSELIKLSKQLGHHMANWVEQALEWAQRIQNGESWITLCNEPDTAKCYRLVIWKDGYGREIGGSYGKKHCIAFSIGGTGKTSICNAPASNVNSFQFSSNDQFDTTVPLVVDYDYA